VEHSLETLTSCPSCGNNSFINELSCKDFTYSKDSFSIVRCAKCELLYTNPRPDEASIGKYYDNPDYVSHTDTSSGLLFTIYSIVKNYTLKQKRALLEGLTTDRTILDYGAGTGDFSAELVNNNWSVSSYEPDHNARKKIEQKSSSISIIESIESLDSSSMSAITLWHVLEHVHRLQETIKVFHRILKDDGVLVIAVPNHTSYDASFYRSNWAAYDVPRHLYHFNPQTIQTLLSNNGFCLKEIKPMWFDSYYVSLLSEKNSRGSGILTNSLGWIRATIIGSISNFRATKANGKCSSVIYVFEKAI